jgi:hypothetical protein
MPSTWISRRARRSGGTSYRVMYRLGGRESAPRYAGAFSTMREARIRRDWVAGELAGLRVPNVRLLTEPVKAPTLADAARRWQESRVDISENTRLQHRSAVNAVLPAWRSARRRHHASRSRRPRRGARGEGSEA